MYKDAEYQNMALATEGVCPVKSPHDCVSGMNDSARKTSSILFGIVAALLFALATTGFSQAQEGQSGQKPKIADPAKSNSTQPAAQAPTAKTHPNDPMLWDAEQMMEEAVQQISARYKLTAPQEDYTRLLLKKRVREFLDQYESEVRELLQESIDIRLGRKDSDPAALMKWAIRAMPVYDAAKNAILDGNNEWRAILDEEQIKTHDLDLRLMAANFEGVTGTLRQWEKGEGRLAVAGGSAGGAAQQSGGITGPGALARRPEIEDSWIAYVERFINVYKLDDAKRIAAREKIHKEQLEKAKQYREANKEKFRKIDEEREKIGPEHPVEVRMRMIRETDQKRRDLEAPIHRLFIDLTRRLDTLPSSKQRAAVTEADRKSLDELYRRLAGAGTKSDAASREKAGDSAGPSKDEKPGEAPAKDARPEDSPAKDAPKTGEAAKSSEAPPKPVEPAPEKPETEPESKPESIPD